MPYPVFTVGHSTHSLESFEALLRQHDVAVVCDVRSTPFSRFAPQFNRPSLEAHFEGSTIEYAFMGRELGARRQEEECYREGRADYDLIAKTDAFLSGVTQLIVASGTLRVALMCTERDPLECHRMILVCPQLVSRGIEVRHILGNGSVEHHSDTEQRLLRAVGVTENLVTGAPEALSIAYRRQAERIAYTPKPPADRRSHVS